MRAEIERLTELCDETKLEIDELKYSGAGLSDGFNREEVDHKTDALDAMRKMLKNKRMDCTAARSVVVEIEQCISGILERLEALRVESSPKAHHHHHPQHQHEDGDNDDDEELEDGIAGGVSAANSVMVFSHRPGSPNHEPHVDGGNDPSEKLGHIEMRTKELIQDLRDMERYAGTYGFAWQEGRREEQSGADVGIRNELTATIRHRHARAWPRAHACSRPRRVQKDLVLYALANLAVTSLWFIEHCCLRAGREDPEQSYTLC